MKSVALAFQATRYSRGGWRCLGLVAWASLTSIPLQAILAQSWPLSAIGPDSLAGPAIHPAERPTTRPLDLPESLDQWTSSANATSDLEDWLRWLVLKNLPPSYEDNRRWGLEKNVYDGFRFRREGWRIETKRQYETVKHGTWSRYYLEFIEPAQRLQLRLQRFEIHSEEQFLMELRIEAPLRAFGRISQWHRDVQLLSLSANAELTARLDVAAMVAMRVNPLVFPPEIQFEPQVQRADLQLVQFEVQRISQLHGPLAEELGRGVRRMVDDRLSAYSDKLVLKMNEQLAKQHDKLRLSLGQALPKELGWPSSAPK
jgi:hypothetical protein